MWDSIKNAIQHGAADEARICDDIAGRMDQIGAQAEQDGDMASYTGHAAVAGQLRERAARARDWLAD